MHMSGLHYRGFRGWGDETSGEGVGGSVCVCVGGARSECGEVAHQWRSYLSVVVIRCAVQGCAVQGGFIVVRH